MDFGCVKTGKFKMMIVKITVHLSNGQKSLELGRLNNSLLRHHRSEMVVRTINFDSKMPISQIEVRSSEGFIRVITFMTGRGSNQRCFSSVGSGENKNLDLTHNFYIPEGHHLIGVKFCTDDSSFERTIKFSTFKSS